MSKKRTHHVIRKGAVPEPIRKALAVLWEHSTDATWSIYEKNEVHKIIGMDCETDTAAVFTFVIPTI